MTRAGAARRLASLAWLIAASACACAAHAEGETTETVVAASDYDYRGESQTERGPALQVSIDHIEDSLWKSGVFLSNVHFGQDPYVGDPRLEVSPYVELMHKTHDGLQLGTGANFYAYMIDGGQGYDYGELYGYGAFHDLKTSLFFTPNYDGREPHARLDAWYVSLDGTTPLINHFSLMEHAGYAWGAYWKQINGGSKIDYSLGLDYGIGKFELMLQYIATRRLPTADGASINSTARMVFQIETVLPWSLNHE